MKKFKDSIAIAALIRVIAGTNDSILNDLSENQSKIEYISVSSISITVVFTDGQSEGYSYKSEVLRPRERHIIS